MLRVGRRLGVSEQAAAKHVEFPERLRALEADLRTVTPGVFRLDVPGWFGGG